jgi:adenine-specific DNA-methyltransferase
MTTNNQKLELTWMGKGEQPALEPRLLLLEPEHSEGDLDTDNMLIHGDNLLALKALEQQFAGQVKCIYIDPPYNTGNAFEHYDDMQEHSVWLNLMKHRLEILKNLLHTEGSIWVTLDDNEVHYCKVMMDEIFGRGNFICDIAWEKRTSPPPDTKNIGYIHDHILCYRKSELFKRNLLAFTDDQTDRYKNPDNDPRGPWQSMDYTCRYTAKERPNLYYPIIQPFTGEEIWPKTTRVWATSREMHEINVTKDRIWWGPNGTQKVPRIKNFLSEIQQGMMPMSLWKHSLAGHNQEAAKEMLGLFGIDKFTTPKPERLIQTVLNIATKQGDLVLDSFLGSGTTAAVAHKMGRRWIGIELGDHAYTHCLPRLRKVVRGEDMGGITKAVNWTGGGGFKTYRLAESLLEKDENGILTFNPDFTDEMVAEAVAKIEGYAPLPPKRETANGETAPVRPFWMQSVGLEKSYLYVTKLFITKQWLDDLVAQMPDDVSLLICCPAYVTGCERAYPRIKLKKIPQAFQTAYEFDKDDYSLNVNNVMPQAEEETDFEGVDTEGGNILPKKVVKKGNERQVSLF